MGRQMNLRKLMVDCHGSELLELAFGLPILLVMAVAISQVGGAFNLQHILSNAAREGARVAANEFSDYGTLSNCATGTCVSPVVETVSNYLLNAGVYPQCTFNTTGTSAGTFAWTFTATGSSSGCSYASLTVERAVQVANGASTIKSTRVTLIYPDRYTMSGMASLIGGTFKLPLTLSGDAVMPDIN